MDRNKKIKDLKMLLNKVQCLRKFDSVNVNDLINELRKLQELKTTKTKILLKELPTEKNWDTLKNTIIDDLETKIGDAHNL